MGRTCGEPNEIELTAIGVKLNGAVLERDGRAVLGLDRRARGAAQLLLRLATVQRHRPRLGPGQ